MEFYNKIYFSDFGIDNLIKQSGNYKSDIMKKYFLFILLLVIFYNPSLYSFDNYLPGKIYNLDSKKNFLPFDYFKVHKKQIITTNPISLGVLFFFNLYRYHLSKLDGPKCPYYPTCSQFGVEAVKQYGALWGLVMLFNRQMREYPNLDIDPLYPKVIRYGKLRVYDPPYRAYIWSKWWEKK